MTACRVTSRHRVILSSRPHIQSPPLMGDHPKPTVAAFTGDNERSGGVLRLAADNLEKVYKRRRVGRDVSVEIKQGEIVGLLGPNGAGKTTTFYMIVGLVKPDGGRVTLGS